MKPRVFCTLGKAHLWWLRVPQRCSCRDSVYCGDSGKVLDDGQSVRQGGGEIYCPASGNMERLRRAEQWRMIIITYSRGSWCMASPSFSWWVTVCTVCFGSPRSTVRSK